LPADALTAAGYEILSRSVIAGADVFMKQKKSLFLFLQGHPEYDSDSLLREHHRDISRFLRNERDAYPQMPRGYFDGQTAAALVAFRKRALAQRHIDLLSEFPAIDAPGKLPNGWRTQGVRIYANWLSLIANSKLNAQARAHARAI